MKIPPTFLIYSFLLIFVITGSACSLTSNLTARLGGAGKPTPTRPRRFVVLPPAPTPVGALAALTPSAAPTATLSITLLPAAPRPRPTATLRPNDFLAQLTKLLNTFGASTATPTRVLQLVALPTIPPSPTAIPSPTATLIPTETSSPIPTPTDTPMFIPSDTPTFLPTEPPAPPPTNTPIPTLIPSPAAMVESASSSPLATPESKPAEVETGYDFLQAEFYNSPTANSFMVMYVAIVDAKDIPIGDMKIVGTRLDYNLTYESPLSTWYFEGYNAPGEVIKSGNVKFEPPGGIETTHWVLHLEDANGSRMSDDIPFDTDQNNKQWYFIKLRRKF